MSREMNDKSSLEISGSKKIDVRISQTWALSARAWARSMIVGVRKRGGSYRPPIYGKLDLALRSAGRE